MKQKKRRRKQKRLPKPLLKTPQKPPKKSQKKIARTPSSLYRVNIDFDAYDCFKGGLEDLVIIRYPSGLGVYVYIKDGKPDYDNREEYLPVLWVDTEENNVNQRKLEPGESVEVYFKTAISEAENKNSDERAAEDANPEPNPKTGNRFPWF